MPRLKLNLPGPAVPWTKTPNSVFDRLVPTLKDTELRVLLVLVRQTHGWKREGKSVVLSYRTLKARTGRQSEAISKALASLALRGLIHRASALTHRTSLNSNPNRSQTEEQH